MSIRQTLSCRKTDKEGPDQTRTHRDGHMGHLLQGYACVGERPLHYAVEAFEVCTGGDLGNDTAVAFVFLLRVDNIGEGAATRGVEDGGAGIVARRFYS